ncbi:carbohydrate ABC transporter permease [Actinopolymorpha pittospori]
MVLNRGLRGLPIYRSIFYLPSLLGGSVAVGLLWRRVFGSDGLLNQVLGLVGFDNLPSWIGSPDYALWTLMIHNVWTFGSPMVIFLAGLRQIPSELYESASVDGARKLRQFIHITIPLLTPVIFFNLILQIIGAFQAFTPAYVIGGGNGGPNDSTLFYTLYLYMTGFKQFDMGKASAMAWVLLIVIALFTAVNFLGSKRWVFYADE